MMGEYRNTKRVLESRLSYFASLHKLKCRLENDQPEKYNLYSLSVKKTDLEDWINITNFIKTTELLNFLNFSNNLKEYELKNP